MNPADPIADLDLTLVHPDGRRVPARIWIERPAQVTAREATCVVGIDGLQPRRAISGSDPLQALLLALRVASIAIADFTAKGGRMVYTETGEPMELEPYFGSLVSPRATFAELDWRRLDVSAIVESSGLVLVGPAHRQRCQRWFAYQEYGSFAVDCSLGKRSVLEQIGHHLKWKEQFGYELEEREGNLNAIRDGFDFPAPESGRFVLEFLEPEVLWRENEGWFEGLLTIASDHSRHQLAIGRRFFTVLWAEDSSPLVGLVVDKVVVPPAWTPPKRPI